MTTIDQSDDFNIESKAKEINELLSNDREIIERIADIDTQKALNKLKTTRRGKVIYMQMGRMLRYASVILLVLAIGYFANDFIIKRELENTFAVYTIPNTEMGDLTLPDGTKLKLNSASELKYSMNFMKSREVYLTGEGYFEVESNPKNPFLVHLNDYTVKVTGTKFNVKSYSNQNPETTLDEGKVTVLGISGNELVVLKPGESLTLDKKNNKFLVSEINTALKRNWTEGKIFLKNQTILEMAEIIERWYNVKVVFDDEAIKQIKITGTILKDKPVEQLLNVLVRSESVDYKFLTDNNAKRQVHIMYR